MKMTLAAFLLFLLAPAQYSVAALNQAPAIDLAGLTGRVQLEQLKGGVVYLDFWASWCSPCKKSFPWMNQIKQRYADQGLEIVAVNLDRDRQLADKFLQQVVTNFIVAFDADGKSASDYQLRGMPGSYLIDREGNLRASHLGFRDEDKTTLEQAIKDLLNQ